MAKTATSPLPPLAKERTAILKRTEETLLLRRARASMDGVTLHPGKYRMVTVVTVAPLGRQAG